jgi:hypothetical protein
MKQFKHVKTGAIATLNADGYYIGNSTVYYIPAWIVENSDDWVEVDKYNELVERLREYQKELIDANRDNDNYTTLVRKITVIIQDIENIINGK